jgi:hypothetical protein
VNRFDALAADPLAWQQTAATFILAGNELYAIERRATPTGFSWRSSGSNWPILLLYATAAENLLKAVRIAQGAVVVTNGKLDAYLCSHKLTKYATDAAIVLNQDEGELLVTLQDVLEAGKYPVAKQPGKNLQAWNLAYPEDVEAIWRLLQRLDGALRATGTRCMPPFEVGKLHRPESDGAAEQRDEADEAREG